MAPPALENVRGFLTQHNTQNKMSMLPPKMALTPEQIQTLAKAQIIPAGTPAAQVEVFALACQQYGLSPFKKEIYLMAYNTKHGVRYAVIVGIDGFRNIAARTGLHAGVDDTKYNLQADGSFYTAAQLKARKMLPDTATVTTYKVVAGQRCPFTHTCVFSEFYPKVISGQDDKSKAFEMPFQMISKCAEAFALKKAFGNELAGLHIEEEMAAFNSQTIDAQPEDVQIVEPLALNMGELQDEIYKCESPEALNALFATDARHMRPEIKQMFTARKKELIELYAKGQIPA